VLLARTRFWQETELARRMHRTTIHGIPLVKRVISRVNGFRLYSPVAPDSLANQF
jgi:hypothetical protein